MTSPYVAVSHNERDQIIDALTAYFSAPDADPALVERMSVPFASAAAAYTLARTTHEERTSAVSATILAASAADDAFDRDLRLLARSFHAEDGALVPHVSAELLGGVLPSELVRRPHREKVQRARALLNRLSVRTDLCYDATAAAALRVSTEALASAVASDEAAKRALRSAADGLKTARRAFDSQYAAVVALGRGILGPTAMKTVFPYFSRTPAAKDGAVAEAPAPA